MRGERQAEREPLPKAYDPRGVEERLYRLWEEGGSFAPRIDPAHQPFCIIMPPPNVTGELHLGHALTASVEDILVRWHRMLGDVTLWLPGVDHAGIATQNVVERELAREGLSRHDLGRERFLERVWEWVARYRPIITDQHKRLGVSCDWSRERFTMDPGPQRAVRTTFVNLYRDGLIYRGERIINWCPRCQTALSDLEVEHRLEQPNLYYIRYPLLDGRGDDIPGEWIEVATTRPETLVGDVAVAISPGDPRWRHLVGRRVRLPIVNRLIPVIEDEAVDREFGTGALKVTPGHDPVDFEIGQRHGLPVLRAMNLDGTLNEEAGPYAGQERFEARRGMVQQLTAEGLLMKEEAYATSIGHCDRCDTVVEPLASTQWFVRMEPLAREALAAVREGRIRIIPERFGRVYENWLESIRDWCISRQLWWGHRIPVWYCDACGAQFASVAETVVACEKCGSREVRQDPDVLDTWFSSALWPHSTLGWPEEAEDLRTFYPTSVLETGYDILFFWVARMIMLGLYNTKEVPFRTVYLHGLVRDPRGEKMTKSKGNVVNPLDAVEKYGADALRFTLTTAGAPGNDMRLTDERLEGSRNFANKLWNAARFVLGELGDGRVTPLSPEEMAARPWEERWICSRLDRTVKAVDGYLRGWMINEAGRQIHSFLWGELFDWYFEMSKVRLRAGDRSPLPVLVHALETGLRLLHPYMPFVTEEIYQQLREHQREPAAELLIVAPYPRVAPAWRDAEAEAVVEVVIDVVRAIRNIRAEKGVAAARWVEAYVEPRSTPEWLQGHPELKGGRMNLGGALRPLSAIIEQLARVRPLHLLTDGARPPEEQVITDVLAGARVVLPVGSLFDVAAERARLQERLAKGEAEVRRLEEKLATPSFRAKAPPHVVSQEGARLAAARAQLEGLRQELVQLG